MTIQLCIGHYCTVHSINARAISTSIYEVWHTWSTVEHISRFQPLYVYPISYAAFLGRSVWRICGGYFNFHYTYANEYASAQSEVLRVPHMPSCSAEVVCKKSPTPGSKRFEIDICLNILPVTNEYPPFTCVLAAGTIMGIGFDSVINTCTWMWWCSVNPRICYKRLPRLNMYVPGIC